MSYLSFSQFQNLKKYEQKTDQKMRRLYKGFNGHASGNIMLTFAQFERELNSFLDKNYVENLVFKLNHSLKIHPPKIDTN